MHTFLFDDRSLAGFVLGLGLITAASFAGGMLVGVRMDLSVESDPTLAAVATVPAEFEPLAAAPVPDTLVALGSHESSGDALESAAPIPGGRAAAANDRPVAPVRRSVPDRDVARERPIPGDTHEVDPGGVRHPSIGIDSLADDDTRRGAPAVASLPPAGGHNGATAAVAAATGWSERLQAGIPALAAASSATVPAAGPGPPGPGSPDTDRSAAAPAADSGSEPVRGRSANPASLPNDDQLSRALAFVADGSNAEFSSIVAAATGKSANDQFSVQVGAFRQERNAMEMETRLRAKGYDVWLAGIGSTLTAVRIGRYAERSHAVMAAENFRDREGLPVLVQPVARAPMAAGPAAMGPGAGRAGPAEN